MESGRAETPVYGTLKTLFNCEQTWRSNDVDGNGVKDYWTLDVAGMACLLNSKGDPLQHISLDVARADAGSAGRYSDLIEVRSPKQGYYFMAVPEDAEGKPLALDTDGDGKATSNLDHFAFCGYPAEYGEGSRNTFLLADDGQTWRKDLGPQGRGVQKLPANPAAEGWRVAD